MSVLHSKSDARTHRTPKASAKGNMCLCVRTDCFWSATSPRVAFTGGFEELRRWQRGDEVCDRFENSLFHSFLRFACCLELALRHAQGMVATLDDVPEIPRFHLGSHPLQKIQRTQRVARSLHKQDRRSQRAQNFVANFCAIAHGAERIAKTNQAFEFFLERHVTSDTAAHAFADEQEAWC